MVSEVDPLAAERSYSGYTQPAAAQGLMNRFLNRAHVLSIPVPALAANGTFTELPVYIPDVPGYAPYDATVAGAVTATFLSASFAASADVAALSNVDYFSLIINQEGPNAAGKAVVAQADVTLARIGATLPKFTPVRIRAQVAAADAQALIGANGLSFTIVQNGAGKAVPAGTLQVLIALSAPLSAALGV